MATHIDLLRHGDTGQRGFRGWLDDPLSVQGWEEMRRAVASGEWDVVVGSPLQRCALFAREFARARGLPLHLDVRWREYGFGDWQHVPVDELAREQADALARFWADPAGHPPPGAEPFAVFAARVQAALAALDAWPGRVLVVTHGGPIRWLRCRAAGGSPADMSAIEVAHASLHRLPVGLPESASAIEAGREMRHGAGEREESTPIASDGDTAVENRSTTSMADG